MALADTAKLVAQLVMEDKDFQAGVARSQRALGNLDKSTGSVTQRMGRGFSVLGGAISTALGVGLERAVSAGIGALKSQISQGIEGAQRLESVTVATNQVLASTGGVAGQTADSIRNLATKYEDLNATIDDKVIQSGENLLLTFTQIGPKAFQPALEAALNLNQALGGGEEGLQGTIIQVGKALNSPSIGLTALRRVGVSFTDQQVKQIKTLEKQGKLFEAQKIILAELNKEFGGQFVKAGKTAEAQAASLSDAIDDLRIGFAQGLLPGLANVRSALAETFRDPATKTAIADIGKNIGDFLTPERVRSGIGLAKDAFKGIVDFAKQVPWGAIGTALKIGGTGAKAILDAFASMPSWLQTAVATGWGLNKLTGGLVGKISVDLIGGGLKQLAGSLFQRGGTPATPLFVADVAGGLGKGVPGIPGGGGPNLLGIGLAAGGGALAGNFIGNELIKGQVDISKGFEDKVFQGTFQALEKSGNREAIAKAIGAISQQLNPKDLPSQIALALDVQGVRSTLEGQLDSLNTLLTRVDSQTNTYTKGEQGAASQRARAAAAMARLGVTSLAGNSAIRTTAAQTQARLRTLEGVERGVSGNTAAIAKKNFSPVFNASIAVTSIVSISEVQRKIQSQQIAIGHGIQEGY